MTDISKFSTLEILARTIWAEARGEGEFGMRAVACVVLNRVKSKITWWGNDIRSVCLKPYQFSCWNAGDPNRPLLLAVTYTDPAFGRALSIAGSAMVGSLFDITNNATSYYDKRMAKPPYWAKTKTPCAAIGHHLFFAEPKKSVLVAFVQKVWPHRA